MALASASLGSTQRHVLRQSWETTCLSPNPAFFLMTMPRPAFVFGLNPKGVKDDFLRFDDAGGIDNGWDAVWDGAAKVDSLGWTAEFRIPLSQLRFNAATVNAGGRWGVNFRRYIARRGEASFWAPISANGNAFVSLFGELEGLSGLRQALHSGSVTSVALYPPGGSNQWWRTDSSLIGGSLESSAADC